MYIDIQCIIYKIGMQLPFRQYLLNLMVMFRVKNNNASWSSIKGYFVAFYLICS